jgi:hypothetical protein
MRLLTGCPTLHLNLPTAFPVTSHRPSAHRLTPCRFGISVRCLINEHPNGRYTATTTILCLFNSPLLSVPRSPGLSSCAQELFCEERTARVVDASSVSVAERPMCAMLRVTVSRIRRSLGPRIRFAHSDSCTVRRAASEYAAPCRQKLVFGAHVNFRIACQPSLRMQHNPITATTVHIQTVVRSGVSVRNFATPIFGPSKSREPSHHVNSLTACMQLAYGTSCVGKCRSYRCTFAARDVATHLHQSSARFPRSFVSDSSSVSYDTVWLIQQVAVRDADCVSTLQPRLTSVKP